MSWFQNSSRAQLFVGRLDKGTRTKELEDIFGRYGKLMRCDIKFGRQPSGLGAQFCYAFVDYEDRRDAEIFAHDAYSLIMPSPSLYNKLETIPSPLPHLRSSSQIPLS